MRTKYFFSLLLGASLLIPTHAFADLSPDTSTVGSIGVGAESSVTLLREKVTFTIPRGNLESRDTIPASAVFWLRNTTDRDTTIDTIFPIYFNEGVSGEALQYAKNVTVKVNGRRVSSALKDGSYVSPKKAGGELVEQATTGYAFKVMIPSWEIVKVAINFDAPVGLQYSGGAESSGNLSINYLLASGAGWKGNIGKAEFKIIYPFAIKDQWASLEYKYDADKIAKKISGRSVTWTILDFEPLWSDTVRLNFVAPQTAKQISKNQSLNKYIKIYEKSRIKLLPDQVKELVSVFSLGLSKCVSLKFSEMCSQEMVNDGEYLARLSLLSDKNWNDGKNHEFYFQYGSEGGPIYFGPFKDDVARLNRAASKKDNVLNFAPFNFVFEDESYSLTLPAAFTVEPGIGPGYINPVETASFPRIQVSMMSHGGNPDLKNILALEKTRAANRCGQTDACGKVTGVHFVEIGGQPALKFIVHYKGRRLDDSNGYINEYHYAVAYDTYVLKFSVSVNNLQNPASQSKKLDAIMQTIVFKS